MQHDNRTCLRCLLAGTALSVRIYVIATDTFGFGRDLLTLLHSKMSVVKPTVFSTWRILFAQTHKKVGTLPTCSRRIFSPANFNQSRCRILARTKSPIGLLAWTIGLMRCPRRESWLHFENTTEMVV